MAISLDDFLYQDTATMEVLPPGQTEPIASIVFAGPGHEQTRFQAKIVYARAGRVRPRRALEEAERENAEAIAGRMLDWSGIKRRDEAGEVAEVPFSAEMAIEMLVNPALGWLFEQCAAFVATDTNFLPARKA